MTTQEYNYELVQNIEDLKRLCSKYFKLVDDDFIQDVILTALEVKDRYNYQCKFITWLMGIARKKNAMRLKKQDIINRNLKNYHPDTIIYQDSCNYIKTINKCITELSKVQREIIEMTIAGMKVRDIANVKNKNPDYIKSCLYISRKNLKNRLIHEQVI